MRAIEHHKSMPSGDTMCAGFFVGIYVILFKASPIVWICVPLVGLGRVYQHCHWIGDTIFGGIIGALCAYAFFESSNFHSIGIPILDVLFSLW